MKKVCLILFLAVIISAGGNCADWTMHGKDVARTRYTDESAYDTLTFKWKLNTGQPIVSSPVVYNGVAYIGSRSGTLYAINIFGDTEGGTLKWQYSSATGGWMEAAPAIWNGIVYMPCGDGRVYALDAKTGSLRWSKVVGGNNYSSPVVKDGIVYVGCGYPDKKVVALNAWTGSTVWTFEAGQYVYSSPAVNGTSLYVGANDGKLYCLSLADGSSDWGYQTAFQTNGGIYFSSPCLSDTLVYLAPGDIDRNIYAIRKDQSDDTWTYEVPGAGTTYVSSPALGGDTLYVVSGLNDPNLFALDQLDGVLLWSRAVGAATGQKYLSSPAVAGDRIYVGASGGNIYQFNTSGESRIYNVGDTFPIVSSVCVANGMLLFGSFNGYVYAYEAYSIASISSPLDGGYVGGDTVVIKGSARGESFKRYSVAYGYGTAPSTWTNIITDIDTPVFNDDLAQWGINALSGGHYSLRLVMEIGSYVETSTINVVVDKSYMCTYVSAAAGAVIESADGTKLVIPPNAMSNDDFVVISSPLSYPPASDAYTRPTGVVREIDFGSSSTTLNANAGLYIPYNAGDVVDMSENGLRIYEWDQTAGKWRVLSSSQPSTSERHVYAEVSHFSMFGLMEFAGASVPLLSATTTYCYPNPARLVNKVSFKCFLGQDADIRVYVFNVAGEMVAMLEKWNAAGGVNAVVEWDITNIASGVYVYKVQAIPKSGGKDISVIKKMAIIH